MIYPLIHNLLGQLAGYRRMDIRDQATRNARLAPAALGRITHELFRLRTVDAIHQFLPYSEKVCEFRGSLPDDDEEVAPEEFPVWTREDQRRLFAESPACDDRGTFTHCTGGSTGIPLRFRVTRESYEWRRAVSDRGYAWAGAEEGRKSFFVWGAPIRALSFRKRLVSQMDGWLQGRQFFDSFAFGDDRKILCCAAISRHRPSAIVGYTGSLVELARFVRDNPGRLTWRARTIVTAAEGLQPGQRELLQEFLGDKVFMSYGSREFMLIGMECSRHTGYHVSSDNVFVEVVDADGRPMPPGGSGRLLVTDLRNAATPFIRYEIGDWGVLSPEPCACGLPFPLLSSIDGRAQEEIRIPSGARVSALFLPHLMKEFAWVEGYQVARVSDRILEIRILARAEITADQAGALVQPLREKTGAEMEVRVVRVERLEKNAAGKTPVMVDAATQEV